MQNMNLKRKKIILVLMPIKRMCEKIKQLAIKMFDKRAISGFVPHMIGK